MTQAISLDTTDFRYYLQRGQLFAKLGQVKELFADFDRVIELKPDDATPYYLRGQMYINTRDYANALADFQKGVSLDTVKEPGAYYSTALCYAGLGKAEDAARELQKAITLDDNWREQAQRDKAFDMVRSHPAMTAVLKRKSGKGWNPFRS